jgi:hypothetical protein
LAEGAKCRGTKVRFEAYQVKADLFRRKDCLSC